jgi:hypothetical protein
MLKISKTRLLRDIQSGMDDDDLMTKHEIPLKLFQRLLQRLVDERAISHEELYDKSGVYRTMADTLTLRRHPRVYLPMAVRVFGHDGSQKGLIRDISESGLRVAGIEAQAQQTMTLSLPLKEIETMKPVRFEAVCRWCEKRGKHKKFVMSGFEITRMSDEMRSRLRLLIDFVSLKSPRTETVSASSSCQMSIAGRPRDFSGSIHQMDILDVVHFMLLTGENLMLHVRSCQGEEGWLHLTQGNIVHARAGDIEGVDAFCACMNFPAGEFSTHPWCDPIRRTIDVPGEFLLMEAARMRDESVTTNPRSLSQ